MGIIEGMDFDLERMRALDASLGTPSRAFPSIHVGGTNGKGSVTTKIASCLALEGRDVGLFTSPHISTFRERIQINGEMISEEKAEGFWELFRSKNLKATFFEMMTLMAFLYFAEKKVDCAVIEVGLGGRLDATNILLPLLAVITTIERDHIPLLGTTLEEIAGEKSGIIKTSTPVVVGPKAAPFSVFKKRAEENKCPYHEVRGVYGSYEEENRAIAKRALEVLERPFCAQGLEKTPPCRFEVFQREIPIVLDVAHNPGGFEALFRRLPSKKVHLLLAMGKDKEIDASLLLLSKHASFIHVTESQNVRAASCRELEQKFCALGYATVVSHPSLEQAFALARRKAAEEGALLAVCGTFYIMAPIRKLLGLIEPTDLTLLTPY